MNILPELLEEQKRCTDPERYDELAVEISLAKKVKDIENARRLAEIDAQQKAERERLNADYQSLMDRINETYNDINDQDHIIFNSVVALVGAARKRLKLYQDVLVLEIKAIEVLGPLVGKSYTRRTPALFGGAPARTKLNDLLKVWLQRYIDWSDLLGDPDKVTPEVIASHGLRAGIKADRISEF